MTKSAYKLPPLSCDGLELNTALGAIKEQLKFERERQRVAIKENESVDCTGKTRFSNSAARELIDITTTPRVSYYRQYGWDEMTRAEVYRLLSGYQQRLAISKTLEEYDYKLDYQSRPAEHKFVKNQLWNNVQKSRKRPTLPRINSVRLPLSKPDTAYSVLDQQNRSLDLYLSTLAGDCCLHFELPVKVWANYPGRKVSRPDLVLNANDELSFVFAIDASETEDTGKRETVLGVDIGITRPYAASLVSKTSVIICGAHSLEVERDLKSWRKMGERIAILSAKNKRRAKLGVINENAVREEARLRAKRERQADSLDWQAAADIVSLTTQGDVIALEKLNWGEGGAVKFRHGLQQEKIEHKAAKAGRRVVKVDPKNTSHECPDCERPTNPNAKRITRCNNCGFEADRDDASSIVIADRVLKPGAKKKDRSKHKATPKRPKPRRTLARIIRKTGYTRPSLPRATRRKPATLGADYSTPLTDRLAKWRERSSFW